MPFATKFTTSETEMRIPLRQARPPRMFSVKVIRSKCSTASISHAKFSNLEIWDSERAVARIEAVNGQSEFSLSLFGLRMSYGRALHLKIRILNSKGRLLYEDEEQGTLLDLDGLDLEDAQLAGIEPEAAVLYGAKLKKANLKGADLYWCTAREADFTEANLENASFLGAFCQRAVFRDANLKGADFRMNNLGSGADLAGADLRTPSLFDAHVEGALYSAETLFPEGFDPAAHGMIEVDVSDDS